MNALRTLGIVRRLAGLLLLAFTFGVGQAWAGVARISVQNDRSAAVEVEIDRASAGAVPARSRQVLTIRPGTREVLVRAPSGEVLYRAWHRAGPGEMVSVTLQAIDAPVLIINPLDRPVSILVDGVERATLQPWASVRLDLAFGRRSLQLRLEGRTLVSETLTVGADHRELAWSPNPPRIGDLVVHNPLPIAVRLRLPSGREQVVPAYGQASFPGLSEGRLVVEARRADGGELIESLRVQVWAFDTARASVAPPRTGILALSNLRGRGLVGVEVDGVLRASLSPQTSQRIELSPGSHRVVLRDGHGREIERFHIVVDRFEPSAVEVGGRGSHERPGSGMASNSHHRR